MRSIKLRPRTSLPLPSTGLERNCRREKRETMRPRVWRLMPRDLVMAG